MNIDPRKNLELGKAAFAALKAWQAYVHEVMDVTNKTDAQVNAHIGGALVDVEDALRIPVDAAKAHAG